MIRSCFVMALAAIVIFVSPAAYSNKTPDGVTHAEEVCDDLRDGDYTKGLYGLCVAYCEAEARSERVLDTYNRKRTSNDPEMPCLEEPVCPCWTSDMIAASAQLEPVLCNLGIPDGAGGRDEAAFIDFTVFDYEFFSIDSQGCEYLYDPDMFSSDDTVLGASLPFEDPDEEFVCRADLLALCGF